VRAIASVPGTLDSPALLDDSDSSGIGRLGRLLLEVGGEPAALDHEAVDHAMELGAHVVPAFHVVEEIGHGLGRGFGIKLDLDDARRGVEFDLRIRGAGDGRGERERGHREYFVQHRDASLSR
jgi:hypothetical protein